MEMGCTYWTRFGLSPEGQRLCYIWFGPQHSVAFLFTLPSHLGRAVGKRFADV